MLRNLIVLCCVLGAVLAEQYSDKYDNIDLKEITENDKLMTAYANCVLDKGKCSPEGKALKDHIKDALETGCSKCTEKQNNGVEFMISHLVNSRKELWEEVCAKYDPEGKYRAKYEEKAKSKGINI